MSVIVGIVSADGRPADRLALRRMLRATAHRSPDGGETWNCGVVGLGHGLLRTLPEAPLEVLPLVDGDLALTADARLDNRDELLATLGMPDWSVSDAALILAAYRRWGEGCPEHLLGDFAFAVWDSRRQLLFCARDHFGVKPFYYHASANSFAFASEIKALFALNDMPRRVDEARIADYLIAMIADSQSTFYTEVARLPPSHSLAVSAEGRRLQAYWQLDPPALPSGDDHADQFRDLFRTAVRCRLRGSGPTGAMLSGGLDSSSIACVAAPIAMEERNRSLATFSFVFDKTPAWSERNFIEAVLTRGEFDPFFMALDDYAPFGDFERILAEQEGPFLAPGPVGTRIYRAAAERGVHVLLDGHGGDEVVSHGYGRLHEMALANRWFALWREVRGLAEGSDNSGWRTFAAYFLGLGPGRRIVKALRYRARPLRRLRCLSGDADARPTWHRFVNPDLVARTDLAARYRAQSRAEAEAMTSERARHTQILSSSLQSYAFEVLDRAAAAAGVEARYPFWDKRLVEFCLALPAKEKLQGGWSRLILRRAMEGILPEAVRWRRDKLDFGPQIAQGMLSHHRALIDDILADKAGDIADYANLTEVSAAYRRISERAESADGYDVQAVWRTVTLALWLRTFHSAGGQRDGGRVILRQAAWRPFYEEGHVAV